MKRKGFTLIELMIVMAIVGIIFAIIYGHIKKGDEESSVTVRTERDVYTNDSTYEEVKQKVLPLPEKPRNANWFIKMVATSDDVDSRYDGVSITCFEGYKFVFVVDGNSAGVSQILDKDGKGIPCE